MTKTRHSQSRLSKQSASNVDLTLADVIAHIESDHQLPKSDKDPMLSAVRTLCRMLRKNPAAVSAEPKQLRGLFETISHASGGFSRGHWYNVRCRILAALRQAGIPAVPGRSCMPLTISWEALRDRLPDEHFRRGLSRFLNFCSSRRISPGSVDEAVFESYRHTLENLSLVKRDRRVYQTACRLWNKAAQTVPGWPQLQVPVPSWSRRYSLRWDEFPGTFRTDAEAYLTRTSGQDIFEDDYVRPARPATIEGQRYQLRQVATALVRSGFPLVDLTSLAVLVEPPHARKALRYLYERAGEKKTAHIYRAAILLKVIAKRWVKASEAQIKSLENLCKNLALKNQAGMTQKNRERLRVFNDPVNVRALLKLPGRVLRQVERVDQGLRQDALRVSLALAVEFLIGTPIRIENLAGINIDKHLIRTRPGDEGRVHLVISGKEIKNDEPFEGGLMESTMQFLEVYLRKYHPRLTSKSSPWLFPNRQGRKRRPGNFAAQLSEFIFKEIGIRMNVHIFRHFAVKLYRQAHPGDLGTPQRFLGHKSQETTMRAYAEANIDAALRLYEETIKTARDLLPVPQAGTRQANKGARS